MNGIFKIKACGEVRYAHDATTQGVISKRVVELGDWLEEGTGTFTATAWGSTAYADLRKGDIICGGDHHHVGKLRETHHRLHRLK